MSDHAHPDTARAQAMLLRMKALYHNCCASASFARGDSMKCDTNMVEALRKKADAFEQVAGWMDAAIKELSL